MNEKKYADQVKFIKALAERIPTEAPSDWWRGADDKPPKTQVLADIKRLRRELMELARMINPS